MKEAILRLHWLYIAPLVILSFLSVRGQSSSAKDQTLQSAINYLDSIASYEQAMDLLSNYKDVDSVNLAKYSKLLMKKEQLKSSLDSLELALAEKYNNEEFSEAALQVFLKLRMSQVSSIRIRAVAASDSLINKKKETWFEKYIETPFSLKTTLPWVLLLILIIVLRIIFNYRTNERKLAIFCNNNEEKLAFLSSTKYIHHELISSWMDGQDDGVVGSGPLVLLPHLDSDAPDGMKDFVSASVPSKLVPFVNIFWMFGYRPMFSLHILTEVINNQVSIYAQLLKRKSVMDIWDVTVGEAQLPSTRLDISYQVLQLIKTELNKP